MPLKKLFIFVVLISIVVFAFVIRIQHFLNNPLVMEQGLGPFAVPILYHTLAKALVQGKGFNLVSTINGKETLTPVVFRGPGYPAYLALIYTANGVQAQKPSAADWKIIWNRVRIVQCAMDASLCCAVFTMLVCVFPGATWIGLLGALLQCFNPYTIYYSDILLTEPLSCFLLVWCLALLMLGLCGKRLPVPALCGLFGGLLVLTRPEYLLWLAWAAVCAIFAAGKNVRVRWRLVGCGTMIACALLVVVPWTYRNWKCFGKVIPVATGSVGELLHRGTFEGSYAWQGWAYCPPEILSGLAEQRETGSMYRQYIAAQSTGGAEIFAIDDYFMTRALARIKTAPVECAKAWFANIPRLWFQKYVRMYRDPEPTGNYALGYLVMGAAALLLAGRRRLRILLPLVSVIGYLSLLYLPLHIEPRYSVPAMPLLAALAAAGIGLCALRARQLFTRVFPAAVVCDDRIEK